jgi:outer membrane protein TolC
MDERLRRLEEAMNELLGGEPQEAAPQEDPEGTTEPDVPPEPYGNP